ncbi:MAG: hypothetical protein PHQ40_16415, partial [Anaerolineaceae bacterium]|nr:hypothetical protein [Anaerolineaceae bacterium]
MTAIFHSCPTVITSLLESTPGAIDEANLAAIPRAGKRTGAHGYGAMVVQIERKDKILFGENLSDSFLAVRFDDSLPPGFIRTTIVCVVDSVEKNGLG